MSYLSVEELELLDDSKYRNYISALDKALKNFEYTSEWADLISALGKLMRVLESNPRYTVIPRRVIIAKRLAQCLHPALPSGVHLKALETYNVIFRTIGPTGLAQELFLYSSGIYPLLAHAAINVRPYLLSLYETHIVTLAEHLRPGLSGLITGLLPGLEEGSDHHDKINNLLERVCLGVEPRIFYGCLWQCVADNPGIRLPASSFIVSHLNRKFSIEDQLDILGTNIDLTIQSICASLLDANVLVVRNIMDFLLTAFPLHSSHLLHTDLVQVVAATVSVLLRRDMSLNRRLFSWMLGYETQASEATTVQHAEGPGPVESSTNSYFLLHSKKLLIEALQVTLETCCRDSKSELKPYRILISLLEKPEIGPFILDDILVDVFRALYLSCKKESRSNNQSKDVVKAANLLFGTLEPYYLWSFASRIWRSSFNDVHSSFSEPKIGGGSPSFHETCNLIQFLLDFFANDCVGEIHSEYLPSLLQETGDLLNECNRKLSLGNITKAVELMFSVLHALQPVASITEDRVSKASVDTSRFEDDSKSDDTVFHSPPSSPLLMPSSQRQRQYIEQTISHVQNVLGLILRRYLRCDNVEQNVLGASATELSKQESCTPPEEILNELLSCCFETKAQIPTIGSKGSGSGSSGTYQSFRVSSDVSASDLRAVVRKCCSLLLELSAFPTYCAASAARGCFVVRQLQEWKDLPDWLKLLGVCCCLLPKSDFGLALIAAEAVINFTMLTLSMMPSAWWKVENAAEKSVGTLPPGDVVAVVLVPVISPVDVATLTLRSRMFHLMARRLWEGVSSTCASEQQKSVELFYQLHSLAPRPISYVAEEVVAAELADDSREALAGKQSSAVHRFITLWHLGRDLEPNKWGIQRIRSFDRCLMLLLDSLDSFRNLPHRSLVEGWLCQSLLRNDLSRLLDPLLLRLLQASSARVSIRHVTVSQSEPTEKDDVSEDRVHAISSVDGLVVYHVSEKKSKPQRLRSSAALLATGWEGQGGTSSFVARELPFPWQLSPAADDQSIALFVNPFQEDWSSPQVPATSAAVIASLLDDLIDKVVSKAVAAAAVARIKPSESDSSAVHPLHGHILLYTQVADSQSTLYTLRTLHSLLVAQPRLMLLGLASTSLHTSRSQHCHVLQELLARHRKSMMGRGFHGELSNDWMAPMRNSMYLEVVLMVLLQHLRSLYPKLESSALTKEELASNREVQLYCIQILTLILSELGTLVKEGGKGFASFISDLLGRCRVQKLALHITCATLHNLTLVSHREHQSQRKKKLTLTEEIVLFNEPTAQGTEFTKSALVGNLKLLQSIMLLEYHLNSQDPKENESLPTHPSVSVNPEIAVYQRGTPVHSQALFLSIVISALRKKSLRDLHCEFSKLMAASLPFLGRALPSLLMAVIPQICINLENFQSTSSDAEILPPDYVINQLEALTALCHFTLLEGGLVSGPAVAGSAGLLAGLGTIGFNAGAVTSGSSSFPNGQIFHNLVHAFTPGAEVSSSTFSESSNNPISAARHSLLSNSPRIIACVVNLWLKFCADPAEISTLHRQVKHHLLEFVGPIAHHHGVSFVTAVGVVWRERQSGGTRSKVNLLPAFSKEQLALVDLVTSIRVLPPDTVVQLLRQVIKQPPVVQANSKVNRMEVALLHFFHAYLQRLNQQQLTECWSSFLTLLREISVMVPASLFAGLSVLHEAVQRLSPLADRKEQRELQEVTGKLLESCAAVAGACLEQTTWLRRNLSVRKDMAVSTDLEENAEKKSSESSDDPSSSSSSITSLNSATNNLAAHNSLQALLVLAELLAPLQDIVFVNEEKERVLPLLTTVLANVFPYLKHRSPATLLSFRAASQMLSSLSNFPATRKVWRREVSDLLLDPAFFQMDLASLAHWRVVVDNLMSHDKDAFRELLGRVTLTPSSSLGIFTSRDQEADQRAMLLKRLAFVLFCSDGDQYQRYLPDIQEKLSESLRLPHSMPVIQTHVFLCFRVLLLRTSQHHITSLWPSLIAETIQVLAQLEHEIKRGSEEFSSQLRRLTTLDSSWLTSSSNGLHGHAHPAWLQLYFATCKLLHLTASLPATRLPQFQMYRWAFVGDAATWDQNSNENFCSTSSQLNNVFVPYVTRISRLLRAKMEISGMSDMSACPSSVKSIKDLYPLFAQLEKKKSLWNSASVQLSEAEIIRQIELSLCEDFLESIPSA